MSQHNVILANGEFPIHSYPLKLINNAKNIICTDGSVNKLIKIGIKANIIIGDMDSLDISSAEIKKNMIPDANQNNSDLEKALIYYLENFKDEKLFIIGATGLRDDHNFTNMLLLNKFSSELSISLVTNYYKIIVNKGKNIYPSQPNQQISILPLKRINQISTEGLKYELREASLDSDSRGISNVALHSEFMIESSDNVFVFLEL
jgi:thiamine pyrophosphokinase